ncbi:MAG: OsmC family protein [Solirubrobacterales bacterium]
MRATARQRDGLVHTVEIDGHEIVVDEPIDVGGTDTAPSPTRLVTAALAACTAMTIRLYADRKGWSVDGLVVDVDFPGPPRAGEGTSFEVAVTLPDGLDDDQRGRIMVIAGKCPVHRILASDVEIVTIERPAAP